ncbi:MAG: protoglobin domain-containing protein [Planctomycetaceae bacterium]
MAESSQYERYLELQRYVGWSEDDGARVLAAGPLISRHFVELVEDFYREIDLHPEARKVITGGHAQVERLKGTLVRWLEELFAGRYDHEYVMRRWQVGLRHVEIGLSQVFTNAALSRLRSGLLEALEREWPEGDPKGLLRTRMSLNRLLDLDLALIEDAYQTEFHRREQSVQRLVTIGQVAGGIAHELRNPLNVIKTSVYFLLNARQASPDKIQAHLERIDRQVAAADAVIVGLNNFARLPIPDLQPIDTRKFLAELTETIELPQNIHWRTECSDDVGAFLGDPKQLSIVLSNLIRNARDAMPQGGQLIVSAARDRDGISITVQDTGVGISKEVLQRVMEPLFTTKARGIGLGLAISRAIVEKHNGKLTATSEPDRGSTFTVHLPTAPDQATDPEGDS